MEKPQHSCLAFNYFFSNIEELTTAFTLLELKISGKSPWVCILTWNRLNIFYRPALIPLPFSDIDTLHTSSHRGWLTGTPSSPPLIAYPHNWTILSLSHPSPSLTSPGPPPRFQTHHYFSFQASRFPCGLSLIWLGSFYTQILSCSVYPELRCFRTITPALQFSSAQKLYPFPKIIPPLSLVNSYSSSYQLPKHLKYLLLCLELRRLSILGMQVKMPG